MTSSNMLARVRTLLDESSAGHWSDNEIYRALSDGQREVANYVLRVYRAKIQVNPDDEDLPHVLRELIDKSTNASLSAPSEDSLPNDFWFPLDVRYDYDGTAESGREPCLFREYGRAKYHNEGNTYLASESTAPYVYFDATKIYFETELSGTGSYDLVYIKEPTEIASGTEPILPEFTHNAIVFYAYAEMLKKEGLDNLSQPYYQLFAQQLNNLYI